MSNHMKYVYSIEVEADSVDEAGKKIVDKIQRVFLAHSGVKLMVKGNTVYARKRTAPGAGRPEQKDRFTRAAQRTRGIPSAEERRKLIHIYLTEESKPTPE